VTTANRIDPRGSGLYLTFDSPSDFLATLGGRENPCTAIFRPRDYPTNRVDPSGLLTLNPGQQASARRIGQGAVKVGIGVTVSIGDGPLPAGDVIGWPTIASGLKDIGLGFTGLLAASGATAATAKALASGGTLGPETMMESYVLHNQDCEERKSRPKKVIGLGLDQDLYLFWRTGAITYKNAGWQKAGLSRVDWGRASIDNFYAKLSFQQAAANADAILFELKSFEPGHRAGMTQYEIDYIANSTVLQSKTTYLNNNTR
jgi:hypothetical protein